MVAKVCRPSGNSPGLVRALAILLLTPVLSAVLARSARADTCGPAVVLEGDEPLATTITQLLVERGIDTAPIACPGAHARVERRGATIVVTEVTDVGAPPVERVVTDLAAAATVIESWARTDVTSPLLTAHHVPPVPGAVTVAPPLAARGVQVFVGLETSFSEDHSSWIGTQVGVCVMLGPVCAAVRGRLAATMPEPFDDHLERRAIDILFGGDIPLRLGATTLSPGFAAGLGVVHSKLEMNDRGSETFGLRAEAHAVWTIPVRAHLSVDLGATIDVTQVIDVETSSPGLADEPRLIGRFGAGLRYGGL